MCFYTPHNKEINDFLWQWVREFSLLRKLVAFCPSKLPLCVVEYLQEINFREINFCVDLFSWMRVLTLFAYRKSSGDVIKIIEID